MENNGRSSEVPVIRVRGWEAGHEGILGQLEQMPENFAHPDAFSFPVLYKRLNGICNQSVMV